MKNGGFHLTKFISNDREILKSLPQDDLSANCQSVNLDLEKISLERALGILWNPDNDTNKVKAVKFLSSVFDPLGLLTPSMLEAKLILQQQWKIYLNWNEEIPLNLKWLQIIG